ncbi:MAG: glycosyltransferase family 2 protein [Candidatus Nanopelagicales bacterium]
MSVVIPTRNRRVRLSGLLDRLLADPGDHEIVVVDDGSTDGTAAMLQEYARRGGRVVPVAGPSSGAAAARLEGARRATGDVVVLLDDDVLPEPGLVAGHLAHHQREDDLLVQGYMPTTVPDPLPRGGFATLLYAQEYERSCLGYDADPGLVLTALWMGNISLPRARFVEASEDERMRSFGFRHEDRILGLLLRELGLRGVFDRSIVAHHIHARPLEAFLRDCYENGRGREAIHRLYPDVLPEPSEELYLDGLPGPARSVVAATRHEPVRRALVGALRGGISAAGAVGSRRGELQLARIVRKVEQLHGARDLDATEG